MSYTINFSKQMSGILHPNPNMLKSTKEKMERQSERDSKVAFFEAQKENLKNMKTGGTSLVAFGTELIAALYNGRIDDVLEAFPEAFENAGLKAERHGPLERN